MSKISEEDIDWEIFKRELLNNEECRGGDLLYIINHFEKTINNLEFEIFKLKKPLL